MSAPETDIETVADCGIQTVKGMDVNCNPQSAGRKTCSASLCHALFTGTGGVRRRDGTRRCRAFEDR